MKLKKVAALCSQAGIFQLLDQMDKNGEVVCQWLGDAAAFYPISGLPYMDTDNICAMFDIPEKKQEKSILRHTKAPDSFHWDDTDPAEYQLDDPKLCVRHEGREMLPLRTSAGITFIQRKYLAPLDSLEYLRLYERKGPDGGLYIVAKIGMVIQAVIMPVDIVNEEFVIQMETLTAQCRAALRSKNRRQETELDKWLDTLFQEGEDTGEGAET